MFCLQELENIRARAREKREVKANQRIDFLKNKLSEEKKLKKAEVECGVDEVDEHQENTSEDGAGLVNIKQRKEEDEQTTSEDEEWNGGLFMFPG